MKQLTIYKLQNYNLKSEFRKFLYSGEFLNHLKSKDEEHYQNAKKDELEAVDKWLRDQEEQNYKRLLLLLHSLYNPSQKYDELVEMVPQMASIQESYLTPKYRMLFLRFLQRKKIINVNDSYTSTEHANVNRAEAKKYCIDHNFYHQKWDWELETIKVKDSLFNKFTGKEGPSKFDNYPKWTYKIIDQLDRWSVDDEGIEDVEGIKKYHSRKQGQEKFTFKNFRVHCAEGGLDSDFRDRLFHTDHPNLEYISWDIDNSFPYSLANQLITATKKYTSTSIYSNKKYRYAKVQSDLDVINETAEILHTACKDDEKKEIIVNSLTSFFKKGDGITTEFIFLDLNAQLLVQCNDELDFPSGLVETLEYDNIYLYMLLACSGLIYDVPANYLGVDRKEFKKPFNKCLNFEPNVIYHNDDHIGIKFLKDFFPKIIKRLMKINKNDNGQFNNRMARIELTNTRVVTDYLIDNNQPFVPLQDGIMIPNRVRNEVDNLFPAGNKQRLFLPYSFEKI
ncbi:hypothetical protein [Fodinibius salsisoli]|uniref:Uncharacterized protein n=1 Tax=Fodinibius salsisoli TaxID=2820877 RepID=A0ABT3PP91_9BACT|nr:hypothetical protein [Fodinibius salsisoli]MCW9707675.1 hypothetical protein [Fodinibius salsisoli]